MPKAACDWSKQPLGLVPDEVLAEQLGVSIHTVKRQRHRAGILFIDMDIKKRIADALANRQAMTVNDLADALDKQTTWIQRNCKEMAKAGTLWRHKAGRGYVYTLAGVKYRHLSPFNGSQKAALKASPDEGSALGGRMCDDPVVAVGSVSLIDLDTEDRSDAFQCRRKRQRVTLRHCIDLFGEVHAMRKTHTKCWECGQGATNRLRHCFDLEPSAQLVNDVLQVATEGQHRSRAEARLLRAVENDA